MTVPNFYQRREMQNYARWVHRRGQTAAALRAVCVALVDKLESRQGGAVPPYLAQVLRESVADVRSLGKAESQALYAGGPPREPGWSGEILLASGRPLPDTVRAWEYEGEDPEDTFAVHRFGWVLRLLAVDPSRRATMAVVASIQDWIERGPKARTHPAWQSYTVSERVVNWLFVLLWAQHVAPLSAGQRDLIRDSVSYQADYLLGHLEYHGPGRTNNHLLNNGRALYMAGSALGTERHMAAGRMILTEESHARFTASGFLAEGSSHYHLLLTRTLIEVLWMAQRNQDRAFCDALGESVAKAVRGAQFFFPRPSSPVPLIGDVSPDFPPEWFRGVHLCARTDGDGGVIPAGILSAGWHSLWAGTGAPRPSPIEDPIRLPVPLPGGLLGYSDAGWYRFVEPGYVLFWHAVVPQSPVEGCHAHHDVGSFELHVQDQPVVVDPGRAAYRPGLGGDAWRGAGSHNAVLVDGYEPWVTRGFNGHATMLRTYADPRLEVTWSGGNGAGEVLFRHAGFQRIAGVGIWSRRFLLSSDRIRLMDRLEGTGKCRIESFFHFHPAVETRLDIARMQLTLMAPRVHLLLDYDCRGLQAVETCRMGCFQGGTPAGRFSPQYGQVIPSWSIRFLQEGRLPLESVFEFRVM